MKKIIACAALAIGLATCSTWAVTAQSRSGGDKQPSSAPHKIAVIDMGYIFENYDKFKALSDDLKAEMAQINQQARKKAQKIKSLQQQLKSLNEDSPDYRQREQELTQKMSDFQTFRKMAEKDARRKQSKAFKTVYMEVADLVEQYADHYGYTLVLRFNRDALAEAEGPQEVMQALNRQVIYHRQADDITDPILDYLNGKYAKSNGGAPKQQAGGSRNRRR